MQRKKKTTKKTTKSRSKAEEIAALQRSATMRAVKSRDTTPELAVRKLTSEVRRGARFNDATLPGKPDLVFPAEKKAIFVHGCFWHGHSCVRGRRVPKTNRDYWTRKVSRNRDRDRLAKRSLRRLGWKLLVVWECSTCHTTKVSARLRAFLR